MSSSDEPEKDPSRGDGPPSSRSRRRAAAALRASAEALVQRIAQLEDELLRCHWELAQLVHRARVSASTASAATDLAQMLGLKPVTLRAHALVAERISQTELDTYIALSRLRGFQLTWSHLEALAQARSRDRRQDFAEQTMAEHLSVRSLRARIHRSEAE